MQTSGKLPLFFDPVALWHDVQVCQDTWIPHFNKDYFKGDWSGIALRIPAEPTHGLYPGHGAASTYADTPLLQALPYTQAVLAQLHTPKQSIRYLRLTPGSVIQPHRDPDLVFWDGIARLHIPITTHDQVVFTLEDTHLPMQPGECWYADFSRTHSVANHGHTDRIHLVIDVAVNDWLINVFKQANILAPDEQAPTELEHYDPETLTEIMTHLASMGTPAAQSLIETIKETLRTKQ